MDPLAIPTPDDPAAFAGLVLNAIQSRNWGLLVSLALIGLTFALRRYGPSLPKIGPRLAWINTDRGGIAVVFATSFALALGAATLGGAPVTLSLLLAAFGTGLTAIGGFVGAKKLIAPSGKDRAQAIEAKAAAVQAQAGSGAQAAADAINGALGR